MMGLGYFLFYKKIVDDRFVDALSLLLIRVLFPCLIMAKTVTHFNFSEYSLWWLMPVLAVFFSLIGMAISAISLKFLPNIAYKREYMVSVGFQNAGYLAMNLIVFLFTGDAADTLLVYTFLFIVGFNMLMWSLVPLFLKGSLREHFNWKILFNPPVVATLFSIIWVMIFGEGHMPDIILDPLKQIGNSAFPVAMLTLGAYMCRYQAHDPQHNSPVITSAVIKLMIFPLLVFCLLFFIPADGVLRFFLLLQAILPTSVSLVVIGAYTGADNRFLSSVIFYCHLFSILTMPFWLGLYNLFLK